jgi:hypothetical protein
MVARGNERAGGSVALTRAERECGIFSRRFCRGAGNSQRRNFQDADGLGFPQFADCSQTEIIFDTKSGGDFAG